ncbi:hypothetical protein [Cardinium endosymbiont of Tipula unca]|uniref:hypothetical protein n=1 Tax=Cardinium endosymbiont of Tipula unca TaxID=3066216 RepID=UPI0030CF5875
MLFLAQKTCILKLIIKVINNTSGSTNYLKGILGDKFNATLCAIGHNLRLITRKSSLIPT